MDADDTFHVRGERPRVTVELPAWKQEKVATLAKLLGVLNNKGVNNLKADFGSCEAIFHQKEGVRRLLVQRCGDAWNWDDNVVKELGMDKKTIMKDFAARR
jgi:hypothetical protein